MCISDMVPGKNRVTRRRIIESSGGLALVGMAGCLGDDADDVADDQDDDQDDDDDPGADDTEEKTEIEFWHPLTGTVGDTFESYVEQYNEQSDDYRILSEPQGGWGEAYQNAIQAASAGNPPHLAMMGPGALFGAVESGLFSPAGEILSDLDFDDYVSGLLGFFQIDGEAWAWPFNNGTAVNFYNVEIFEEAGLPDPREDPPETFEEVREAAETIVEETDLDHGIAWNHSQWMTRQFFALGGQPLFNNDNGHDGHPTEINLDSDVATQIWSWWGEMYHDETYLYPGRGDADAAYQTLVGEQVGILGAASEALGPILETEDLEITAGPYSSPTASRTGQILGGGALTTPTDAYETDEDREAVTDFIGWLCSEEIQAQWHKDTGFIPINEGAIDELEDEGWFDDAPEFRVAMDAMLAAEDHPAARNPLVDPFGETMSVMEEVFEHVAEGTEPEEALANAKEEIDDILAQYA